MITMKKEASLCEVFFCLQATNDASIRIMSMDEQTTKVAVIIKHPYRESDWRVDIYDVSIELSNDDIVEYVNSKMLGPFKVMGVSRRIEFEKEINKA